jgi:hypothetical protein
MWTIRGALSAASFSLRFICKALLHKIKWRRLGRLSYATPLARTSYGSPRAPLNLASCFSRSEAVDAVVDATLALLFGRSDRTRLFVLRDFRAGIFIDVIRDFRARHCWVFENFTKSDDLVYLVFYCDVRVFCGGRRAFQSCDPRLGPMWVMGSLSSFFRKLC